MTEETTQEISDVPEWNQSATELTDDQKRVYALFLTGNNPIDLMDHLWGYMDAKERQGCVEESKSLDVLRKEDADSDGSDDYEDFLEQYNFFTNLISDVIWS